ncbi:MAG: glucose-1-phosphate cytidylyltransferase [Actinobacteria bacterium]|nr:glucose-1-phosphate cytidylyltransferase [Actinomycetota bacterium]
MKVVILAGGLGTRLSEETEVKPKPMVEIGGMPILWHIMKVYSSQGFNEFIICLGYKGFLIKEYFANYFLHLSDITIELSTGNIKVHNCKSEEIKMTLVDTGIQTQTGGRIKRIGKYIGNESFMLTYGDGLANINIADLLSFHKENKKFATVTAVSPPGRFGSIMLGNKSEVIKFEEKPLEDSGWINGGFFILEPEVLNYIKDDNTYWEREPMVNLASDGQLSAYKHKGFWKPMDTLRDKTELENLWNSGKAPWKIWD